MAPFFVRIPSSLCPCCRDFLRPSSAAAAVHPSGENHRCGEADQPFPTLGAAIWITLLRGAAVVALAGFLPLAVLPAPLRPEPWSGRRGLIYLGIALADLLDGFVARRLHRQTPLGRRLDVETDAAGLLVALLVAVSLDRLPAFTLLVGLAYYLFCFGIRRRRQQGICLWLRCNRGPMRGSSPAFRWEW
jgi:CDP-diacylglycerol---glycerol-3-phosphate 3-phosphatidyltransferase